MTSYVEKVTNIAHMILWDNILEEFISVSLPAIPYVGVVFANPIVNRLTLWFVDKYLAYPLFLLLCRKGVFVTIDWETEAQYNAYHEEAKKLVPLQEREHWDEDERKKFKEAAKNLIIYHIRS